MPEENLHLDDDGVAELDDDIEIISVEAVTEDDDVGGPVGMEPVDEGGEAEAAEPDLNEEIERLKSEHDHLRELYLRKLAEFDNFRKRTDREREELQRIAGEGVVRDLIPVLDNFERALAHTGEDDFGGFREGVEMIARQFWEVMQRQGLEALNPLGRAFEPEYHEAVQRVEDSGREPGTVVYVLAKGYLFGGRLIRPAMVGVAVEPPGAQRESHGDETQDSEGVETS